MRKTEEHILFPHGSNIIGETTKDMLKLSALLHEINENLLFRSDGISIKITRDTGYPKHRGKSAILRVEISNWDCVA
jgi:hypothetical protein